MKLLTLLTLTFVDWNSLLRIENLLNLIFKDSSKEKAFENALLKLPIQRLQKEFAVHILYTAVYKENNTSTKRIKKNLFTINDGH